MGKKIKTKVFQSLQFRWLWIVLLFVAVDFLGRQIYLMSRSSATGKINTSGIETIPSPPLEAPEGDPEYWGSAENGTHPYYHHGLPVSRKVEEVWRGRRYTRFTNRLGFRDRKVREVALKKAGHRLILIGDSNIFGVGLEWDQTLAGMLQKQFPDVDVLNAAVPSYCPTSEESKLRYLMGRYGLETDAVVLFLDVADVDDELQYGRRADGGTLLRGPQFSEIPANKNWADHLEKFLQKRVENNFTVFGAIVRNARQWLRRHCSWFGLMAYEKGRWSEYRGHLDPLIDEGILRASSSLTRLNEFLKTKNAQMVLVISPGSSQMDLLDSKSRAIVIWEAWGRANDVPVVSLFPLFYAHAKEYPDLIQSSGHWNEKGHVLVAEELFRQLPPRLPWLLAPP